MLVHLIYANEQIHSEEIKYLNELSDRANISQQTKAEMEKILAQDTQHLTLDRIAKQVSLQERGELSIYLPSRTKAAARTMAVGGRIW